MEEIFHDFNILLNLNKVFPLFTEVSKEEWVNSKKPLNNVVVLGVNSLFFGGLHVNVIQMGIQKFFNTLTASCTTYGARSKMR